MNNFLRCQSSNNNLEWREKYICKFLWVWTLFFTYLTDNIFIQDSVGIYPRCDLFSHIVKGFIMQISKCGGCTVASRQIEVLQIKVPSSHHSFSTPDLYMIIPLSSTKSISLSNSKYPSPSLSKNKKEKGYDDEESHHPYPNPSSQTIYPLWLEWHFLSLHVENDNVVSKTKQPPW